jgi:hypothetical protein
LSIFEIQRCPIPLRPFREFPCEGYCIPRSVLYPPLLSLLSLSSLLSPSTLSFVPSLSSRSPQEAIFQSTVAVEQQEQQQEEEEEEEEGQRTIL